MSDALHVRELTARGRGAIRVLELAGPGALERVHAFVGGRRLAPGDFAVVALRDATGALLDEALALADSPERIELHLHGAPALVRRVLAELGATSAPDEPQSLEERAERRLAEAASEAAARVLLDQARGALRAELEALLRASTASAAVERARELARRGRVALRLVTPPRIVLAGPVNAGKSTLFNALVGRERAVVHAEPGTTRDAVRERVLLGAYAADLFDTAGERDLAGADAPERVERAGQALAAELARSADLVLHLAPPGAPLPARAPRVAVVRSQADRVVGEHAGGIPALSARADAHRAREVVEAVFHAVLELPAVPWSRGQGVPFEPEWVEVLERAGSEELTGSVARWLERD